MERTHLTLPAEHQKANTNNDWWTKWIIYQLKRWKVYWMLPVQSGCALCLWQWASFKDGVKNSQNCAQLEVEYHCSIASEGMSWSGFYFLSGCLSVEIPNYRSSWKITPGRHNKDYITSLMWECLGIHQEELESVARAMSGILCFTCNCYNDPDTLGKMDGWICLPLFPSLHFQTSIWGTVQTFKNCGVNWEKHIYRPETGIPIAFIE